MNHPFTLIHLIYMQFRGSHPTESILLENHVYTDLSQAEAALVLLKNPVFVPEVTEEQFDLYQAQRGDCPCDYAEFLAADRKSFELQIAANHKYYIWTAFIQPTN